MVKLTLLNWSQQLSKYRAIRRAGVEQTLLIIHCTLQWLQQIRLTVLQWCCDLQHNYLITTQTTSFNSQTKSEKIFWVTALQLNTESKHVSSDIRQSKKSVCSWLWLQWWFYLRFSGPDQDMPLLIITHISQTAPAMVIIFTLPHWLQTCNKNFSHLICWTKNMQINWISKLFHKYYILSKKMNNVIWVNILNFFLFC